ncbi:class I SAM-dependent methyltransferase [Vibrio metschnikovii]|nr:class I SAM-dependent methyltransferase [Vibrio metschnikovii]EKO3586356.1 class I SAM-dependent methyltransferase [Vibrio metschnikovii]ELF5343546.1 class I SAM-dependent methyltransferase [Vibrio metschnikovii]
MSDKNEYPALKSGMRSLNSGLYDLISDLPYNLVMAEIGCYAGESSAMFLKSGKITEFHAIDVWDKNWVPHYDETREHLIKNQKSIYEDIDWAFWSFKERVKGFNVKIHKMTFDEAMENIPPLDFIYIDGDHSYKGVMSDILNAKEIIKKNGIIAGHDYCDQYKGAIKAVNQVFGKPDRVYRDSSWMVFT